MRIDGANVRLGLGIFFIGACNVLAFAPFGAWWLAPLTLAGLFLAWQQVPKQRGLHGFLYGLGLYATGTHWIYISLHDHGGMPMGLGLIALLGFAGFVALMPMVAGLMSRRLSQKPLHTLFAFPFAWTLLEWTRTWFCTGFPWLAEGYSQVPNSPLAGWIPLFGVYGASLAVSLLAALFAYTYLHRSWRVFVVLSVLVVGGGAFLQHQEFVTPVGKATAVTLIQGNVPQDDKFDPQELKASLERYLSMAQESSDPLIILPESAIPLVYSDIPEAYLSLMRAVGLRNHGDVLVGLFDDPKPDEIHNTMMSLGVSETTRYYKHHLVPFGEFIPMQSLIGPLMDRLLKMPIGSQASGPPGQGLMRLSLGPLAMNICYEDAFGEEIIPVVPDAEFLVNVSNDAWFGPRIGPEQHLQMAATRSLETGREMARVTNTGITAFIDHRGHIVSRAPQEQASSLRGTVSHFTGTTPFVRWSNRPVVLLCVLGLGLLLLSKRD